MISYDLAKELDEADFPYLTREGRVLPQRYTLDLVGHGELPIPTLEELCLALGDELGAIVRLKKGLWRATCPNSSVEVDGADPYEALSRLWLALNPKTV